MDINGFLANIIDGINTVVHSYGWSIIVFTLLIKVLLFPFDYKSRKSMRRMQDLQPQINKLQAKYKNDKEKLNQKTADLYKRERINPLSGCAPMLLTFPVLIFMFGAMRYTANVELAKQTFDFILTGVQINEPWLWVKNLWMPDSPFAMIVADQTALRGIPGDVWTKVLATLDPAMLEQLALHGITADTVVASNFYETIFGVLSQMPAYEAEMLRWSALPVIDLIFTKLTIYQNCNGFLVLPILAALTQFITTMTQPQTASAQSGQAGNMNGFMKYFFPLFSLYICFSSNAAFALYWVVSNIVAGGQSIVLNKIFDAKAKQEALTASEEGSLK